jgi:hypothetical protein
VTAVAAGPRPQLRRLGRHSAIYGIGGLVSRVIAVILLPLYTRLPDAVRLRQDRDAARAHDRDGSRPARRDHERLLPLLLRRGGRRGAAACAAHVVLVHDGRRARSGWSCCSCSPTLSRRSIFGTSGAANLVAQRESRSGPRSTTSR